MEASLIVGGGDYVLEMNKLLKIAVIRNTLPVVSHLIRSGNELNDVDGNGKTLLMYAVANNNHEICRMLLESGADPSIKTPDGKTASSIAQDLGCDEALEVLDSFNVLPVIEHRTNEPMLNPNEWIPVEAMPGGKTENILSGTIRSMNRVVSAHVPVDESEHWMQETDEPKEKVPEYPQDSRETRSSGEDPLVMIFEWCLASGRVFETNLRMISYIQDYENDTYSLLEMLCGQAGIITDYVDPEIAATGEPLPYDETSTAEFSHQARKLTELFYHFLHNDLDPHAPIERETEKNKPLTAKEERQTAQMMEEGYLAVLDVILTNPKILRLLSDMASSIGSDRELCPEFPTEDSEPLCTYAFHTPPVINSLDGTAPLLNVDNACEDERITGVSPEYYAEIRRIENDYSMIASRFGNGKGSNHNETQELRSIGERLYHAGIPVAHLARLHLTLKTMEKEFLKARGGLEKILSQSSFLSSEDREFVFNNPSFSPHLDMILNRIHDHDSSIEKLLRHCINNINSVLLRTGTSLFGFGIMMKKYDSGMKKINMSREIFVKRNLRLVRHVAGKYKKSTLTQADLFQEGVIGLLSAIDRYQHKKGYKFGTYAIYWIKQSITRAILNKSRLIRVPIHLAQHIYRFDQLREIFWFYEKKGRDLLALARLMELPPATIKRLVTIPEAFLWIDDPEKTHELETWLNNQGDQEDEDADFFNEELENTVREILDTLSKRESMVMKMRFGIDQSEAETLELIGNKLHLTRERIRQIESKALQKLRHPSRSKRLRVFL